MTLFSLADNFIQFYYGYTKPEKDGVYRPKIRYFCSYLETCTDIDIWNPMKTLTHLEVKEIFKSMDYYISESLKNENPKDWVTSEATLWNYFTVIKRFFKYLHAEGFTNHRYVEMFVIWENNPETIKALVKPVVMRNDLSPTKPLESYSESDINLMLKEFMSTYSKATCYLEGLVDTNDFVIFVSGLANVFIYETGVRIGRLSIVRIKDVDLDNTSVSIRGIKIPLSKELVNIIMFYLEQRGVKDVNELLFVDPTDAEKAIDNKFLLKFLHRINKTDVTGLIRYRVIKFIEFGIPREVIMRFTGIGNTFFDGFELMNYYEDLESINSQIALKYV